MDAAPQDQTLESPDSLARDIRAFRAALGRVFDNPATAEENFRRAVAFSGIEEGPDKAAEFFRANPASFGKLRPADPDRERALEEAARAGAAAHKARLAQLAQSAPAPSAPGAETDPAKASPEPPGKQAPNVHAGRGRPGAEAETLLQPDPDVTLVDHAFEKIDRAHKAETLGSATAAQREAILSARGILTRMKTQEKIARINAAGFRDLLGKIYVKPGDAAEKIAAEIHGHGEEATLKRLAKDPKAFGSLRTTLRPGVQGLLRMKSTADARALLPAAVLQARAMLRAETAASQPVSWTDPVTKEEHHGREQVRAAASLRLTESSRQLQLDEKSIAALGGYRGTRDDALEAVQALNPTQRAKLEARMGKEKGGPGLAGVADRVLSRTWQMQQLGSMAARMADGPG